MFAIEALIIGMVTPMSFLPSCNITHPWPRAMPCVYAPSLYGSRGTEGVQGI